MNEQNIQNIIAYFTQNPNQDPQALVENLLASGYPRIDIDEALTRLGILSNVLPESPVLKQTVPQSIPAKKNIPVKRIALISVSIAILGTCAYFGMQLLSKTKNQNNITASPAPTKISAPINTPTPQPVTDPANPTQQLLAKGSYSISIEQEILDQDPEKREHSTVQYLFDKTNLVRFEHSSGTVVIVQNNNLYVLDTIKKTYNAYVATKENKETVMQNVREADIIRTFIENTQKGIYTWKKSNETSWKGTNTRTHHMLTVELDSETRLIKRVQEYDEKNTLLSTSTIIIKPVPITALLLQVPTGYTRIENVK